MPGGPHHHHQQDYYELGVILTRKKLYTQVLAHDKRLLRLWHNACGRSCSLGRALALAKPLRAANPISRLRRNAAAPLQAARQLAQCLQSMQATKNLEKAKRVWDGDEAELAQVHNALGFCYFQMAKVRPRMGVMRPLRHAPAAICLWRPCHSAAGVAAPAVACLVRFGRLEGSMGGH
jgi:hypothetical protein